MSEATTEEKLKLASAAIVHVLQRIRDDADIRYKMGAMTGAYSKLQAAWCAMTGKTEGECDQAILDAPITVNGVEQKPIAPIFRDVRTAWEDFLIHEKRGRFAGANAADLIERLREILSPKEEA